MRDYDDKQEKKELLSQWKLEAESRNFVELSLSAPTGALVVRVHCCGSRGSCLRIPLSHRASRSKSRY